MAYWNLTKKLYIRHAHTISRAEKFEFKDNLEELWRTKLEEAIEELKKQVEEWRLRCDLL